jgi:protein-S-isoprenylcysteine O-methyltransferase Ste14
MGMGFALALAGVTKLVASQKSLTLRGAGWIKRFSPGTVKFVALTEIMGGLAIILPPMLDIPSRLVLLAGTAGLIVVMLGAAVIHARLRESGMILLNVVLLASAAVALWDRRSY